MRSKGMRALAFSIDENYEMPFRVLWHSLIETESIPDSSPIFFLHDSAMSLDTIERLGTLVAESGNVPTFINAEKKLPSSLPIKETDHVSPATFYRLYLASLLPKDIRSVIHLDLDVVAMRSARELFNVVLASPIAAVDHARPEESKRVFGDKLGSYFQAGILLIDLEQWRLKKLENRFQDILESDRDRIRWWDQDVLNIAFEGNWQRLPIWFNVCSNIRALIGEQELGNSGIFVHFDGHRKPWLRYSPHRHSEYWYASFERCFGYSLKEQLQHSLAKERLRSRVTWPIRVLSRITSRR